MINLVEILTKKLGKKVNLPTYATDGSAGMDVYLPKETRLYPGNPNLIGCQFSVAIPEGYEIQVRSRSGLSRKGIVVANSPGTIDSDYRGEVGVLLKNHNPLTVTLEAGERIAQLVLKESPKLKWKVVDELPLTARGAGGFGSTGK